MAEIAGLKLIVPSSVAGSGVSVSASGKVTFTAATSANINDCFSATYDNYLIVWRGSVSVNVPGLFARLRSSGSDASGTNYTQQYIFASATVVAGARTTSATSFAVAYPDDDVAINGSHMYFYGPFLAQPTAHRSVSVDPVSGARIVDSANTHSLSTSYDGITIFPSSGTMTGALCVYGLSQ